MFSYEDRMLAVKTYYKCNKNLIAVYNELGYPSPNALRGWINEYETNGNLHKDSRKKPRYTQEQIDKAVSFCLSHDNNISNTVKVLGYPSRMILAKWMQEHGHFDKCIKPSCQKRKNRVKYSIELKKQALSDLLNGMPGYVVAAKYGCSISALGNWKKTIMVEKDTYRNKEEASDSLKEDYNYEATNDDPAVLRSEIEKLRSELEQLRFEADVMKEISKQLKKEVGIDPRTLKNHEKAELINALRNKYKLGRLLEYLSISRSSFYYQQTVMKQPDRYLFQRNLIKRIFNENCGRYGYRRIHVELQRRSVILSEKVIRRIMKEEHLTVSSIKKKKYSSYIGEISPACNNLISRDFHADNPNEKWLTDITEFALPEGKVYLSPIIDCYDGYIVEWTIGTHPTADLVNTMLRSATLKLKPGEHPIIHSDRGCHYRWPEWIKITEETGLIRSMSKKGYSPDNSACEGFFGRIKNEMYYNRDWSKTSIKEFILILDKYLHWYNEKRIKISLGGLSPVEYRSMFINTDY